MAPTKTMPVTRYARSGEASIAYQVVGEGPVDLVFLLGWISQVEQLWEAPSLRRFLEGLAAFSRLILFDRRGSGLSDRVGGVHSLEQEAQDALAVLDAADSERATLLTYTIGGPLGVHLTAEHPDRIGALVMYASTTRTLWAADYDWAMTREQREQLIERNVAAWGESQDLSLATFGPSAADDPSLGVWFTRLQRLAASPAEARILYESTIDLDVRAALARVRAPTLVMHRPNEQVIDVRHSLYAAEHIPGARYVELSGQDSFPFLGDSDAILEEIEEFLTGARSREPARALLTVMFTDIVNSTVRASELGDARWRDLLAHHDEAVREQLTRFRGREVKTVGDGFLATFDGAPSRALRCAQAISAGARALGIEVRVGMHTGECELIDEDVGGMAVHIAARVNGLAGAGEVLVSGTVYGTVVGGPFAFQERGSHELKGVPGRWPVFALQA
jgi:class 3 adenylate cyclase